jgi:hypothetical protein
MAAIFQQYDPIDYKQALTKGAMLPCDRCMANRAYARRAAIIEKANELPAGWEAQRVKYPNGYALQIICPTCLADEQAHYKNVASDIALEKFEAMKEAYIDWQFLVVQGGGIARKSDGEAWLMQRYDIDEYRARQITNQVTEGPNYFMVSREGVEWQEWTARRPAPTPEQYPEIEFEVYERP